MADPSWTITPETLTGGGFLAVFGWVANAFTGFLKDARQMMKDLSATLIEEKNHRTEQHEYMVEMRKLVKTHRVVAVENIEPT